MFPSMESHFPWEVWTQKLPWFLKICCPIKEIVSVSVFPGSNWSTVDFKIDMMDSASFFPPSTIWSVQSRIAMAAEAYFHTWHMANMFQEWHPHDFCIIFNLAKPNQIGMLCCHLFIDWNFIFSKSLDNLLAKIKNKKQETKSYLHFFY